MSKNKLIKSTPLNPSPNQSLRVAGLLFAVLLSVICFPDSVQADYVEGRVRVMRAEGPTVEVTTNGARVEVKTGTELTQGTAIRTGASGEVDLMFDNGGVLEIKPNTEFLIEKFDLAPKKRGGAFGLFGFMALGGFEVQRGFISKGRV